MNSIFESLDQELLRKPLWGPVPDNLPEEEITVGVLLKHCKKGDEIYFAERFFSLKGHYLVYRASKEANKLCAAMDIKYAKFELLLEERTQGLDEPVSQSPSFAIKLSRGNKFSLFYARSQPELDEIAAVFNRCFIRKDIHSRYTVENVLESGSSSTIFVTRENSTGRRVVAKGINKESLTNREHGVSSLWQEIEMLRLIEGKKNLVSLLEVHETKNSVYLLMEYLEGGSLHEMINEPEILPKNTVVTIAQGLINALVQLKDCQMHHRDIKPANIMLRKRENIMPEDVVLIDFGLAALETDSKLLFKRCGTPGYIAPELIALKELSKFSIPEKADIYALGVTLYCLCTKKPLFDKEQYSQEKILKENLRSRIIFPKVRFQSFGDDVVDLLKNMLHPKPEDRSSVFQLFGHRLFKVLIEEDFESSFEEEDDNVSSLETSSIPVLKPNRPFVIKNIDKIFALKKRLLCKNHPPSVGIVAYNLEPARTNPKSSRKIRLNTLLTQAARTTDAPTDYQGSKVARVINSSKNEFKQIDDIESTYIGENTRLNSEFMNSDSKQ